MENRMTEADQRDNIVCKGMVICVIVAAQLLSKEEQEILTFIVPPEGQRHGLMAEVLSPESSRISMDISFMTEREIDVVEHMFTMAFMDPKVEAEYNELHPGYKPKCVLMRTDKLVSMTITIKEDGNEG